MGFWKFCMRTSRAASDVWTSVENTGVSTMSQARPLILGNRMLLIKLSILKEAISTQHSAHAAVWPTRRRSSGYGVLVTPQCLPKCRVLTAEGLPCPEAFLSQDCGDFISDHVAMLFDRPLEGLAGH